MTRKGASRSAVGTVFGVVGAVAAVFAVVLYLLDPDVLIIAGFNAALSIVGVTVYLTTHRGELRKMAGDRKSSLYVLEFALVIGVVCIAVALNVFAARAAKSWDLTHDQLFTLSPQAQQVAASLEKDTKILAFLRSDDARRESLTQLFLLLEQQSSKLTLRIQDPNKASPEDIQKYALDQAGPKIVVTQGDKNYSKVSAPTEAMLTKALLQLNEGRAQKIYFLTGHGEPTLTDAKEETGYSLFHQRLIGEGYRSDALSLLDAGSVPEDAGILVVAGARTRFLQSEIELLQTWLASGGRLLVFLEPGATAGLESLLLRYGIEADENLVLETNAQRHASGFGEDGIVVAQYDPHPITNKLDNSIMLLFRANSVRPKLGFHGENVVLFRSSGSSYGENSWRKPDHVQDGEDLAGPLPLAVAAKHAAQNNKAGNADTRLVVVGDAHFASNRFLGLAGHQNFLLNTVAWMTGDEANIQIRPKQRSATSIALTNWQELGIVFFSVNLLPLAFIGLGFSVWAVRRQR